MADVKVNEFKINIDEKEYTFRLDFRALLKFCDKYNVNEENEDAKEAMEIFNDFLQGKDVYSAIIKILSCSCEEKDFTEEELEKGLSFDFKTMRLMDEITFALAEGVFINNEGSEEVKNEKTSQKE